VVGTVTATLFSGSGASLTYLNVSNVSTGTLAIANGGTGLTTLVQTLFYMVVQQIPLLHQLILYMIPQH
jgi:hypothetical protein